MPTVSATLQKVRERRPPRGDASCHSTYHQAMINSLSKLLTALSGKLTTTSVVLHPSKICPTCGSRLCEAGGRELHPHEPLDVAAAGSPHPNTNWCCPNPDCPPQVRARLELWCSPAAMDIKICDAAMVTQLVQRGLVRDAAEFYRLRLSELAALDGMEAAKAHALLDAIAASRQRDAWRVLFGLGIPNIGAAEAESLCKHFAALDALFATGGELLLQMAGVTQVMARSLTHWLSDPVNRKLIRRLEKAGVNFKTSASR